MTEQELQQTLRQLHPDSFGWALHCCAGNEADAEDVLQTVYLKILEGKARFDGKSSFKTWLFSVIRFSAIDAQRRQKSQQSKLAMIPQTDEAMDDSEHQEIETTDLAIFREALYQLPERQKEILLLVFYHDHSIAEAAVIMGVSVGSARTHYERGKEALRKKLHHVKI